MRGVGEISVGTTLNSLAGLCRDTNRLDEAEHLFEQALAVYRVALGNDHVCTSIILENIANLYEKSTITLQPSRTSTSASRSGCCGGRRA